MGCADSREALCKAIEAGVSATNISQLATECGDVNFIDKKSGETPLHLCVIHNANEIAELLLSRHNAMVDITDGTGRVPLYTASLGGRYDVVQVLLRYGANVNGVAPSGYTALMGASWRGHTNIVTLLLREGAMIGARTNEGKSALSLASEWSHQNVVDMLTTAIAAAAPAHLPSTQTVAAPVASVDHVAISIER